jgi:hypothetical protein
LRIWPDVVERLGIDSVSTNHALFPTTVEMIRSGLIRAHFFHQPVPLRYSVYPGASARRRVEWALITDLPVERLLTGRQPAQRYSA